jgi:hypothetical protein
MYTILFHISGLALIEVLFYFYYIGPLETVIFKDAVSNAITSNHDIDNLEPIYIISPFNTSEYIKIEEGYETNVTSSFKSDVDKAIDERNHENDKVFHTALCYWSILFIISIFVCIIQLSIQYRLFINNKNDRIHKINSISGMNLEMIERKTLTNECDKVSSLNDGLCVDVDLDIDIESSTMSPNKVNLKESIQNEKFFNWDNIKKEVKDKSIHYTLLGIGILGFEYFFFSVCYIKLYSNFYRRIGIFII